jgi:hypothetical protein
MASVHWFMWFVVVLKVFLFELCQHTESGWFYILKLCPVRVPFLILLICSHFFHDLSSLIPHLTPNLQFSNWSICICFRDPAFMPDALIRTWVKAFLSCPYLKLLGQLSWYGNMPRASRPRNRDSITIKNEIFFSSPQRPDRFCSPPSLLSDGYQGLCPWGGEGRG